MRQVIVYSTNQCPYCVLAKEWLEENKIPFEEKNVQQDQKAAAEMIAKSGQRGVPVIEIDGKIVIGFDVPALKRLLNME